MERERDREREREKKRQRERERGKVRKRDVFSLCLLPVGRTSPCISAII